MPNAESVWIPVKPITKVYQPQHERTNEMTRYSVIATALILISCTAQDRSGQPVGEEHHADSAGTEAVEVITAHHGFTSGLLDKDGVLWFGTNGSGVFRYDGNTFTALSERDGLCNDQVHTIIQDHEGVLWFGTVKGLCRYERGAFTSIPLPFRDTTG
ncbi:MAG: hypothetical protein KDC00_12605 [Flavobacteriales bacterium]|nr:hypothetical protein [Flavobacteriales bacterium]